jgi:hypothetical protein
MLLARTCTAVISNAGGWDKGSEDMPASLARQTMTRNGLEVLCRDDGKNGQSARIRIETWRGSLPDLRLSPARVWVMPPLSSPASRLVPAHGASSAMPKGFQSQSPSPWRTSFSPQGYRQHRSGLPSPIHHRQLIGIDPVDLGSISHKTFVKMVFINILAYGFFIDTL